MLSIIILTKNSESTIADCLESLKNFGDEILVIDSNSEDRTRDIAKMLGAKVIQHPFENFADQRNYALKHAQGDWVLYLDSDEQAISEFKKEVTALIQNHDSNSEVNGYYIFRKIYYYGKDWGFADRVQRLFYKKNFIEWVGAVHETPKVKGKFGQVESPILHFTHRNLAEMVKKTNEWSEYESDLRLAAHHPKMTSWRFFRVILTGFFKSYIGDRGYRNGTYGLVEGIYQAFSYYITYAKLWEKQRKI